MLASNPTEGSATEFRARLRAEQPAIAGALKAEDWTSLDRLITASPLYARLLLLRPDLLAWLLADGPRRLSVTAEWRRCQASPSQAGLADLALLRKFRRQMSLLVAYRDVNSLAAPATTLDDLSNLADFCLQQCLALALDKWTQRLGQPWDEELQKPARFCVLALGKLGGRELNFFSDIDLLYLYEGEGHSRKENATTHFSNAEVFAKAAETLTASLQEHTAEGFLYRVDLRLRPEGAHGPLVCALGALENYYASVGQTWERLMLIKARPVAGDRQLGDELLESLHSFRYPRHAPPSLLADVAALKVRTEKEVVGTDALPRDIKSGPGGIREIEFIAQSQQLLHAGRYPFLQTAATVEALSRLARYQHLSTGQAKFLTEAYWFLRSLEHRLQMREEQQTHLLPVEPAELDIIARGLGFATREEFDAHLGRVRSRIRAIYSDFFSGVRTDDDLEDWWLFLAEDKAAPALAAKLHRWFGGEPDVSRQVRAFALGDHSGLVTREAVSRFAHLADTFDRVLPELATPLATLRRIARFAERYGPRHQFFLAGAANPEFFRVLALLFDRSEYIHETLCAHPEIFEEVLRSEILRKKKTARQFAEELRHSSQAENFPAWLCLYVRAEQVRHAIGELLNFFTPPEVEAGLTALADSVLTLLLSRRDPRQSLLLVALGKHGGGELTFGSDLDVLFVARDAAPMTLVSIIQELQRDLIGPGPADAIYKLDLRLRPHGEAGPYYTTNRALADYHRSAAQPWEKQLLTKARVVTGPARLAAQFKSTVENLLYAHPLHAGEAQAVWAMRGRIERERDVVVPPERAFKTTAGGLIDFEFLAQILQLTFGHQHPTIRTPNTDAALRALAAVRLLSEDEAQKLRANHAFLKRVEIHLRRDANHPVSTLPDSPARLQVLAHWLGYASADDFWAEYRSRLAATRETVAAILARHCALPRA